MIETRTERLEALTKLVRDFAESIDTDSLTTKLDWQMKEDLETAVRCLHGAFAASALQDMA